MRIEKGHMVALGYGKYVRAESIVGLEPIVDSRGPGKRTRVYVEHLDEPLMASRSERAILRDQVATPKAEMKVWEQREVLHDLLDAISDLNSMLRSIIRDQGHWDVDQFEARSARC
ncbi:MAG: hypothetical protein OEU26_10885 [Candidatus Tectomicrobia bacterium]|nr:hypothetical protein [Candidatus Tectomicrobia bacterium]